MKKDVDKSCKDSNNKAQYFLSHCTIVVIYNYYNELYLYCLAHACLLGSFILFLDYNC